MSKADTVVAAIRDYMTSAGVPLTEFNPDFVVKMISAMMVSYHKYGRDAANFAMIEAMHPGRKDGASWGTNDAADSPGRTTASGHRLVQETNDGTRIIGETILHLPDEGKISA